MPVAFEPGGSPLKAYELQRMTEDAFVESSVVFDQQHGPQGTHTDITADSIDTNTDGVLLRVNSGLRLMKGPLVFEEDGNTPNEAVVQPTQLTSDQNDYNPNGLATAFVLELDASVPVTITGLVTERRRRALLLINRGSATITLAHNSVSSTSTYRFFFDGLQDCTLTSGAVLWIYYEAGSEIWRGSNPSVAFSPIVSLQRVLVTYDPGATTATAAISAVDLNKSDISFVGETYSTNAANLGNVSRLDLNNTTSTSIAIQRLTAVDGAANNVTTFTVVQVVEYL